MRYYLGGFDPIKLIEGILNALIKKNILTKEEGQAIIDAANLEIQKKKKIEEEQKSKTFLEKVKEFINPKGLTKKTSSDIN